jgi:hypothetical protein
MPERDALPSTKGWTVEERRQYRPLSYGDLGHAAGCKFCGCVVIDRSIHSRCCLSEGCRTKGCRLQLDHRGLCDVANPEVL